MKKSIFFALLAAVLYAISIPFSKIILNYMSPTFSAGFLYLGAGIGMFIFILIRRNLKKVHIENKLSKKDFPYTLSMVLLDIIAPILLMFGLKSAVPENVSLLNNFEIVATSIIALLFFREKISRNLWIGIILVTISSFLLSFENIKSLQFSLGSIFVILACICWGVENNCTRQISDKDPAEIVMIKGIFSGLGSIIIAFLIGEKIEFIWCIFALLGLGFVSYGLSILFYVYAQRTLGAAKTSAYYSV